jgi:hypothetical protein
MADAHQGELPRVEHADEGQVVGSATVEGGPRRRRRLRRRSSGAGGAVRHHPHQARRFHRQQGHGEAGMGVDRHGTRRRRSRTPGNAAAPPRGMGRPRLSAR